MRPIARVAHASRVLATVSHRRELCEDLAASPTLPRPEKFVAVRHRDQHPRRVRYPEKGA